MRTPLLPLVLLPCLALGACAAPRTAEAPASEPSSASVVPSSARAAGIADACALVPAAELQAVIGAEPPAGTPATGRIDGGQCTWKVSDTRSVLVQYTRQPDAYLPADVWKEPEGAVDLEGVDRGWVDAGTHSILAVKDGRGLLLTDVGLGEDDPEAFLALGRAVAARL